MTRNWRLVGIGGWLSLLVAIVIFTGAINVFHAVDGGAWKAVEAQSPSLLKHTAFQNYQIMDRAVQFGAGLSLLYCGYLFFRRKEPRTVQLSKLTIGIVFPASVIFRDLFAPYFFLGVNLSHEETLTEVVRVMMWSAVWTLYLYRSERVKNTYINVI